MQEAASLGSDRKIHNPARKTASGTNSRVTSAEDGITPVGSFAIIFGTRTAQRRIMIIASGKRKNTNQSGGTEQERIINEKDKPEKVRARMDLISQGQSRMTEVSTVNQTTLR